MSDDMLCYCPKCGQQRFRQTGTMKFACEGCSFTYYKNVAAAVAAIIEHQGRILLTRRAVDPGKGKWDLPGGFVDSEQDLEESLKREVREELGLEIDELSYLGSFPNRYPYKGIEYATADSIFVCKPRSLDIQCDGDEIAGYELVDPRHQLDLNEVAFTSIRAALRRYQDVIGGDCEVSSVGQTEELMQLAIDKAKEGMGRGQSPFGCAISHDGEIIAASHNLVLQSTDITAHAEITALREACRKVGQVHLTGALVASTCEPCPMCMAALHWAQVAVVCYGATIADAAGAGFNELTLPAAELVRRGQSTVKLVPGVLEQQCRELFSEWQRSATRRSY